MAADGSIIIDTKIDQSGLDSGMTKLQSAAKAGAAAIAGAIGVAVTAFAAHGIKLASDLAEVQNVVDTTFGSNSTAVSEWAKNAGDAFGISELAAKQYASTLGAMMKSQGVSAESTKEMSTSLAGLAGDMASFYNLDPSEAFEKLRAGISGESEPLKQLGIDVSDTALKTYALSQGITESTATMTAAEKSTLRYGLIMSQTKDAQGDFSKTSGAFANQQRTLQMNMDMLAASLGSKLLPALNSLTSIAIGLVKWLGDNAETIGLVASVVTGAAAAFGLWTLVVNASTIATKAAAIAQGFLNTVMSMNPIMLVVIAIGALVAAVIYLWNTNEGFRNALIGAWNAIRATFVSVGAAIHGVLSGISSAFQNLVGWFNGLPGRIRDALGNIGEIGRNLVLGIWNGILNTAGWLLDKIKGFAHSITQGIKDFFGISSPSTLFEDEVGVNLALGVGKGFTGKISDVVGSMSRSVSSEMGRFSNSVLGGSSSANSSAMSTTIQSGAIQIILPAGSNAETARAAGSGVLTALAYELNRS